jgi:hypothetical protein
MTCDSCLPLLTRLDHIVVLNISRNKLTLLEALPPQLQILNVSKVRWPGCLLATLFVSAKGDISRVTVFCRTCCYRSRARKAADTWRSSTLVTTSS